MQLPRENLYGAIKGNPPPIKVPARWTASPCAKKGMVVQMLFPSCSKAAGWGKVSGYSGLLPGQTSWPGRKMQHPGYSWGSRCCPGALRQLGVAREKEHQRGGRDGGPPAAILQGDLCCCCFALATAISVQVCKHLWIKWSGSSGYAEMAFKLRSFNLVIQMHLFKCK